MCIVVDVNTMSSVFSSESANHSDFLPVKEYIMENRGKMVIGGKKYLEELAKMPNHLKLVKLLIENRLAVKIIDTVVDKRQEEIEKLTKGTDCDDAHIIALIGVSRTPLLCSLDKRSYPFVKDKRFYERGEKVPKIYKSKSKNSLKLLEHKTSPSMLKNVA